MPRSRSRSRSRDRRHGDRSRHHRSRSRERHHRERSKDDERTARSRANGERHRHSSREQAEHRSSHGQSSGKDRRRRRSRQGNNAGASPQCAVPAACLRCRIWNRHGVQHCTTVPQHCGSSCWCQSLVVNCAGPAVAKIHGTAGNAPGVRLLSKERPNKQPLPRMSRPSKGSAWRRGVQSSSSSSSRCHLQQQPP